MRKRQLNIIWFHRATLSPLAEFLTASFYLHVLCREDERQGDDDGRRAGVRDPADDHREAAIRSSRKDHWAARGVVLWSPVHR